MSQPLNWQSGEPSYFAEGNCHRLYACYLDLNDERRRWALLTWWYGDAPDKTNIRHFKCAAEAIVAAQELECFADIFESEFEAEP